MRITAGGSSYGNKGNFDRAIADFSEAIRLDPKDARAYHDRGVAYGKKGEMAKAEEDFAQAKRPSGQVERGIEQDSRAAPLRNLKRGR